MARDGKDWLEDILQSITDITDFTVGMDAASFHKADRKTLLAVTAAFTEIGEAVKALPAGLKARHPDIEWIKIAGLRDILVHEYFRKDTDIIWDVIARGKLNGLKAVVEAELKGL